MEYQIVQFLAIIYSRDHEFWYSLMAFSSENTHELLCYLRVDQLLLKAQTNEFTFQVDAPLPCLRFPTSYQITRLRLSDT